MRVAVLTVSDRSARGEREDRSGPELARVTADQGWTVAHQTVGEDDVGRIAEILSAWSDAGTVDLIQIGRAHV